MASSVVQDGVPLPQAEAARPWVWVTGASRGIGRACAIHLGTLGYRVAVCFGHNEVAALQVVAQINQQAGIQVAIAHQMDLSAGAEAIGAAVQALLKTTGTPWALVHNAGITGDGLLTLQSFAAWQRVIEVNLLSFWALMRPVARGMLKAREGRIVTMASVAGLRGNGGQSAYAASKAGLIGASKSLALELAPRGITVNAIAPGFIDTDMTAKLDADELVRHVPMKRLGRPEDVAHAAAFLCSRGAAYITGEVLGVHGGLYT